MKKPRMIIFDFGHTLLAELGFDSLKGTCALMEYATANPLHLTAEQVNEHTERLFFETCAKARDVGIETHEFSFQHLAYEYQRLEFSIDNARIEKVFWDAAAPAAQMPHVETMLDYLRDNNIRTGVISNIAYSGEALKNRIKEFLPKYSFDFIIASSEYVVRKPEPLIFELALRKADLPAKDVWMCGDSVRADVEGAASVGIFPVWYEDLTLENTWHDPGKPQPTMAHLHIHDWLEMIEALKRCD
ncbi:haloacid dehalogenase [Clostridia bacterium]|nr:haloacid dehalogenase [Clostridia bacterium]